jgi:hypothetical protein
MERLERRGRVRWLALRVLLSGLVLLGVQLVARPARAHVWMIRHGFAECGGCHVDPMGGETLTGMGRVMGESLLAQHWAEPLPTDRAKLAFGVTEPDDVRLGGSLRVLSVSNLETDQTAIFPMQADAYGAAFWRRFSLGLSLGLARASRHYEHSSKARVLGDVEGEGVLLVSRNHWVGYSPIDNLVLRVGRLNLPFGLRIPEHTAWIRSETSTDRESDQLDGAAIAFSRGPFRGELLVSVGNLQAWEPAFQQRGYSAYAELLVLRRLAVGASSMVLRAPRELEVDHGPVWRHAHGLTLRHSPWTPVVLLAEANVLKNTGAGWGYVGMVTLDVEPVRGVHLSLAREWLDRGEPDVGGPASGRGQSREGTWWTLDWFFAPHLEARIDFVQRAQRADMILAQLHLFL